MAHENKPLSLGQILQGLTLRRVEDYSFDAYYALERIALDLKMREESEEIERGTPDWGARYAGLFDDIQQQLEQFVKTTREHDKARKQRGGKNE